MENIPFWAMDSRHLLAALRSRLGQLPTGNSFAAHLYEEEPGRRDSVDQTVKNFDAILKEEKDRIDWIEAQLDQIKQTGRQNYVVGQIY